MRTTHFARNLVSGLVLVSKANHASSTPATIGCFVPQVRGFLSSAYVGYVRMQRWRGSADQHVVPATTRSYADGSVTNRASYHRDRLWDDEWTKCIRRLPYFHSLCAALERSHFQSACHTRWVKTGEPCSGDTALHSWAWVVVNKEGFFLTFSYKRWNRCGSLVLPLHFRALKDLLLMIRLERRMWEERVGNFFFISLVFGQFQL